MNSIFRGDVVSPQGRILAWVDALFIDHAVFRLVWTNLAAVKPGVLYRANHPTPGRLGRLCRKYGITTVINLRGPTGNGSDALSREAARKLGLAFHDMSLESRGAPQKDRIFRLHGIYQQLDGPALIHCKSGADRAGLAAALFVMFQGGTAAEALKQLSLRYGHFSMARTGILDAFFRMYQQQGEGKKPFLDWVRDDYDEAELRRSFHANRWATFITDKVLRRE